MLDKPSVDDWLVALPDMRRRGSEFCGPCPLCGGQDRFHVREGRSGALVGCRGCIDGQPHGRTRFGELVQQVFGDHFGPKSRQCSRNSPLSTARLYREHSPSAQTPARAEDRRRAAEFGRRLWIEAALVLTPLSTGPASTHPARRWISARHLLHPWQTPPPTLRWHDHDQLLVAGLWPLDAIQNAWPELPDGDPPAVHCIAIDEEGRKRCPARWAGKDKRTYGPITDTGAILALGDPGDTDAPVHIVEGLADALAVYSRRRGLVLAAITTVHAILNRPGVLGRLYGCRALVWPDQDGPGLESVSKLAEGLDAVGITHAIAQDADALDPADWSARQGWPDLDADAFTETAGRFLDEGQPPAEADRLAVHTLMQGGLVP